MDCMSRLVLLVVVILNLVGQAAASTLWFKGKGPSLSKSAAGYAFDADLTKLIESPAASQSDVYMQAKQLLKLMQSAPSCNRIATSNLLTSCQSIEGLSANTEAAIEDVRATYAAQLAICELRSAGAQIPTHCNMMLPTKEDLQAPSRNTPEGRELTQCLQTLESRPQWWTSYSNNKQNAVVMCRAARVDIERDDLIRILGSWATTSSNINEALEEAVKDAHRQLMQHRDFAEAIESFQKQTLEDLKRSKEEAQSYFMSFVQSALSTTESLFKKISTKLGVMETDIAELGENLSRFTFETSDLAKSIAKIFEGVLRGSSELASRQNEEWDRSKSLANDLQVSLESIRESEVSAILMGFQELSRQMQVMNDRQDQSERYLSTVSISIEHIQKNALASEAIQMKTMETQYRLHEELQRVAESTGERLAAIDASATSVGAKMQDIYSMLLPLIDLGGVAQTIGKWKWPCIVVLTLFLIHRQIALYALVSLGGFYLLSDLLSSIVPPDHFFIHYASGYQIPTVVLLRAICILSLVCSAVLWAWKRTDLPQLRLSGHSVPKSALPMTV